MFSRIPNEVDWGSVGIVSVAVCGGDRGGVTCDIGGDDEACQRFKVRVGMYKLTLAIRYLYGGG